MTMTIHYPSDEELEAVWLVREVAGIWSGLDDAEKLKLARLLAFVAGSTYPTLGKLVKEQSKHGHKRGQHPLRAAWILDV